MEVVVDLAAPADDAGIRRLMDRQVMPGRVKLATPREPDFSLGCAVTGADSRILVARSAEDGAVVGVACRSIRSAFVNGVEQRLGYLGQLRIDERYRGRWLVSRGFSLLAKIDREDPLPAYLTAIVDGNDEATGVLVGKRRRSFPAYRLAARYVTLALPLWRSKPALGGPEDIAPATSDALPEVVRFLRRDGARRQFFSAWTESSLRDLTALGLRIEDIRVARVGGEIAGVMALWDQTAYKQAVVRGYSGWLKLVASVSTIGAPLFPRAIVPGVGDALRSAYAAFICVANDDSRLFGRLLREIFNLARSRRFDYLLVGLDARDPFLGIARAYAHVSYPSRLFLVTWAGRSGEPGASNSPRGGSFHEQLDDRLAYVDVATL
jgi:hypothetical protein